MAAQERGLWAWLRKRSSERTTASNLRPPARQGRTPSGLPVPRVTETPDYQQLTLGRLDALLETSTSTRDTLTLEVMRSMVESGQAELPRLPALALQLQALEVDGPEDSHHIAALVQTDREVTACVMEAASAARFGVLPAQTLEHAIVRLGLSAVQSIAIGASAHAVIYRIPGYDEEASLLGAQAMACARACHALARSHHQEPGVAFLAGLFHDVGEVLVLRTLSAVRARMQGEQASQQLMQRLSLHLHIPLGAWFAQARALPEPVRDAIAFHHAPIDGLSGMVWAVQTLQRLPDGADLPLAAEWDALAPPPGAVQEALRRLQRQAA